MRKAKQNQGFSLVELLISIVILAILMLPLFNHFITTARINQQVAKLRSLEVTAINLMEAVKGQSIQDVLSEFAVDDAEGITKLGEFHLLPLLIGSDYYAEELIRLDTADLTKAYPNATTDKASDGIYALSIIGLKIDGNAYDLLLKINTKTYTDDELPVATKYNDYELPVMNELDDQSVAMVDTMMKIGTQSLDDLAIEEFMKRHQEYIQEVNQYNDALTAEYNNAVANRQAVIDEGITPTPTVIPSPSYIYPDIYTDLQIKEAISKKTTITVLPVGSSYRVVANAIYTVADSVSLKGNTDPENQTYQITFVDTLYQNPITYLYVFYTPSTYQKEREILQLHNSQGDDASETTLNAYIIKQQDESAIEPVLPYCTVMKEISSKPIQLFSNMKYAEGALGNEVALSSGLLLDGTIERKDTKDWIYDIDIRIYEHESVPAQRYQELQYEITSTGIEN